MKLSVMAAAAEFATIAKIEVDLRVEASTGAVAGDVKTTTETTKERTARFKLSVMTAAAEFATIAKNEVDLGVEVLAGAVAESLQSLLRNMRRKVEWGMKNCVSLAMLHLANAK